MQNILYAAYWNIDILCLSLSGNSTFVASFTVYTKQIQY